MSFIAQLVLLAFLMLGCAVVALLLVFSIFYLFLRFRFGHAYAVRRVLWLAAALAK